MLDTETGMPYGYENDDWFKVHQIVPNYPTTIRSWTGASCQFKCPRNKYLDPATQQCEFKPKCAYANRYRREEDGACVTCPAGQRPDAQQRSCEEMGLKIKVAVTKLCSPTAETKLQDADTVDICLAKVKVEFNKPLPPAKMNKKMFIWMFDPLTKVC